MQENSLWKGKILIHSFEREMRENVRYQMNERLRGYSRNVKMAKREKKKNTKEMWKWAEMKKKYQKIPLKEEWI